MAPTENAAPFAYDGLDRVIHEKARLGVLASLAAHRKGLAFGDLRRLCGLTDGNLSRHLQVLHEAGLVEINVTPPPMAAKTVLLRAPIPVDWQIESAEVDGAPAVLVDGDTIELSGRTEPMKVRFAVRKNP